jgi:hypothetical protein
VRTSHTPPGESLFSGSVANIQLSAGTVADEELAVTSVPDGLITTSSGTVRGVPPVPPVVRDAPDLLSKVYWPVSCSSAGLEAVVSVRQ